MEYGNLRIIGTSHIARQSLVEIKKAFESDVPDIVAVELDKRRLYSLIHDVRAKPGIADIRRIGFKGFLFAIIGGWLQEKLGNIVGVKPGSEMKLAVQLAKKNSAKVALIDQDIEVTLSKLSRRLTWREKFRFLGDMIKSIIFKKSAMKEMGIKSTTVNLSKVPEKKLIRNLILQLKKKYPNVYSVLVKERNVIMARNLAKILQDFPENKVLAVVGAGHEEDILTIVKKNISGKVDIVGSL